MSRVAAPIRRVGVSAYTIPTDAPESDGTLEWDSTTVVVVELSAGGETGLGYTYGPRAAATLVDEKLAGIGRGRDAFDDVWPELGRQLRNAGRPGIGSMAIAAVGISLWGLRGRLRGGAPGEDAG